MKGMLPKNKLAAAQLNKLKIYAGPDHPHAAQNPAPIEERSYGQDRHAVAYRGTGKRKTSVARVVLVPGAGVVTVNGRPVEEYFPRQTLRAIATVAARRSPAPTRHYDVRARIDGGGISGQAGRAPPRHLAGAHRGRRRTCAST